LPLSDRDYMRPSPPPARKPRNNAGFNINPVLVIVVINFVFYIATVINSSILVNLGVIPAYFLERPWTVLTAMFIHSGFLHILFNMITLYFFGRAVYQLVGSNKFLLVYFVGGIAGNLLYVLLGEPYSIAVGASGAVYAIAGALVVIVPKLTVRLYFFIPMPLWVVILIFFVAWSFIPGLGIAWQAHVGGLVVGLVAGYFFRKKLRYIVYR
jgi:membrane associated rhomboid family serine protease